MASITRTIGAATTLTLGSFIRWTNTDSPYIADIPISFMQDQAGVTSARLVDFVLNRTGSPNTSQFNVTTNLSTGVGSHGQDLISSWETFGSAIIVEAGSLRLELPGPNNSGNDLQDTGERYIWRPSAAKRTEINNFITSYNDLSDSQKAATTLTLRDELPLPAASAPSVSINDIATLSDDSTQVFTASVSGGTYDTLSYSWSVISGGGTFSSTSASTTTYSPPSVTSNTAVQISVTVTARGTGTNARNGTSQSRAATEDFTVTPSTVSIGINGSLDIGAATLSGTLDIADPLVLADYDSTGQEVVMLALIQAGSVSQSGGIGLYATSEFSASGSILDGSLTVSGTSPAVTLTRIMYTLSESGTPAGLLRFNDRPNPADLGDFFDTGGDGDDLTISIQTIYGVESLDTSSFRNGGGHFTNFINTADFLAQLQSINDGDRFIIALHREAATVDIEGSINTGAVGLSGTLSKFSTVVDINGSLDIGAATLSGTLSKYSIIVDIEGEIDAGAVTLSGTLSKRSIIVSIEGSLDAGAVTLSGALSKESIPATPIDIEGSLDAGAVTLTGSLIKEDIPISYIDVGGSLDTGAITLSGTLTSRSIFVDIEGLILPSVLLSGTLSKIAYVDIDGSLNAGAVVLTGDLAKVAAATDIDIEGSIDIGSVIFSGTLSVDGALSLSERIALARSRSSWFYIDLSKPSRYPYDPSALMEFREGVYDEFTSYFIEEMKKLPSAGTYTIKEEFRPDIYSYDVYKTTDHWYLLLLYNNVLLMTDLIRGTILRFPSLEALEDIYSSLRISENRGIRNVV